jgi:LPPG:FO 2-phospho-L-lactate transferase
MKVTALAGGTGAAKLLRGLVRVVDPGDVTIIGNTGDDAQVWGLHVSPDLDTVMYALAGRLDVTRGWGLADESFHCLDAMGGLGGDTWFNLGDRDLATHLVRTQALRAGRTLSEVTAELCRRLGVGARVLPMSDDPVRTRIETPDGWLDFQEYFVREKAQPAVRSVAYAGAERARPAPGVIDAIRDADARGLEVSAAGVATAYAPWLHVLVVDTSDPDAAAAVTRRGVRPVAATTLMTDRATEIALARTVIEQGEA